MVPSGVVDELFEDPTATEEVTSGASVSEEGAGDDGPARWPVFPSSLGRRYGAQRAAVMERTIGTKKPEGLTATYNRFHDLDERGA